MGMVERCNVAKDMLGAVQDGDLLDWWIQNSPNEATKYPWELKHELPCKTPETLSCKIEIIGFSGAGKSEFLRYASKFFDSSDVLIRPELITKDEHGLQENWSHGEHSQKMQGMMASEFGVRHQMQIWNQVKLISHIQGSLDQLQSEGLLSLIIERGCNDVLSTDSFTRPEHYSLRYDPLFDDSWLVLMFSSIMYAQYVDAVILFGTSFDETRTRRMAAGLTPEGSYINLNNWSETVSGYEWWLGSFYPLFRERCGMGLLVIDGTADMEENNKKALDFCRQVFALKN